MVLNQWIVFFINSYSLGGRLVFRAGGANVRATAQYVMQLF